MSIIKTIKNKGTVNKSTVNTNMVHQDEWQKLRQFTDARIGLGRVGTSIPTVELLRFQLSHAQAIDAVHVPLNVDLLCEQFAKSTLLQPYLPSQRLHSKAQSRSEYLQRPDLGRQLSQASLLALQSSASESYDLVFVIADGLSSYAITHHAQALLETLISRLNEDTEKQWKIAPLCIVLQGRVAIGDDVAETLNAKQVILLIGERPGLSSPDSMGLYLTWNAQRGMDDSFRNCISNIRPAGLQYDVAAHRCHYLLNESYRRKMSGVHLKDCSEETRLKSIPSQKFCLT